MVTTSLDARAIAQTVTDPELPMLTLHDLGVLRDVRVDGERVIVEITPTYSGCPAMAEMRSDLTARLHHAGYVEVDVRTVLSPPWTTDDITERGRQVLAEHGIAPPGPAPRRGPGPVPLALGVRPPAVACPLCGSAETELVSQFGATSCKSLHRCVSCREPFEQVKAH
ncbi:MAG: phenylacetate-CoA oxygenase subunit PaaJ [Pseudonocardiales bacterium]|nr:MAG: phenylacetate-CoA oxygenase subunit PaaJ [Pseudonocardiales bacterium]